METLLLSIKFFLKMAGVILASYWGTEKANNTIKQTENTVIESTREEIIKPSQEQKTVSIDSTLVHLNCNIKKSISTENFSG